MNRNADTPHTLTRRDVLVTGSAAALGLLPMTESRADEASKFPSKPVTLVITSQAGNVTDVNTRQLAQKLSAIWNQPVVVDQKVGANGSIGASFVARSAPDGHTILVTTTALVQTLALRKKLPYDIFKDLTPVSQTFLLRLGFFVDASLGVNTMQEFLQLVRANPGKYTSGSFGVGSTAHLLVEKLNHDLRIDLRHVPYQGTPAAMQGLISGQVDTALLDPFIAKSYVDQGKLKVLCTTGPKRSFFLPQTPTFAEAGIKGFNVDNWAGWFAPGGTPEAITAKIASDIAQVQKDPDVIASYQKSGIEMASTTPAEYRKILRRDADYWIDIVTASKIEV